MRSCIECGCEIHYGEFCSQRCYIVSVDGDE